MIAGGRNVRNLVFVLVMHFVNLGFEVEHLSFEEIDSSLILFELTLESGNLVHSVGELFSEVVNFDTPLMGLWFVVDLAHLFFFFPEHRLIVLHNLDGQTW